MSPDTRIGLGSQEGYGGKRAFEYDHLLLQRPAKEGRPDDDRRLPEPDLDDLPAPAAGDQEEDVRGDAVEEESMFSEDDASEGFSDEEMRE